MTINNILPGPVRTDRLHGNLATDAATKRACRRRGRARARAAVPAGRFGDADEFGQLCAFLCSTHAGYITGQNLLIDGGA